MYERYGDHSVAEKLRLTARTKLGAVVGDRGKTSCSIRRDLGELKRTGKAT